MLISMSRLSPVPRMTTRVPPVNGPCDGTRRVTEMSEVPMPPSGNMVIPSGTIIMASPGLPSTIGGGVIVSSPLQPVERATDTRTAKKAILLIPTPAEAKPPRRGPPLLSVTVSKYRRRKGEVKERSPLFFGRFRTIEVKA